MAGERFSIHDELTEETVVVRLTGHEIPVEEEPGEPPVCPGCGAVAKVLNIALPGDVVAWSWVTDHELDCSWMSDPDSEAYS